MRYRMLALDLDGTLFDSTGRVPPAHLQAVQRAKDAGMLVVLCTGRGLNESRGALEQLDHQGPIVLANGAIISDPTTGRTLHRMVLEPHLALDIVHLLDDGPDAVLVLLDPEPTGLDYLVTSAHQMTGNTLWWFDQIEARLKHVDQVTEDDLHHALRVGIVGPTHRMPQVASKVVERFGSRVFVQHFTAVKQADEDVNVLEVFVQGVNKWAGLSWLAEAHDIAAEQVAAIGDQVNDIQMIESAGCGIAMANAIDQVRRLARHTTASNDEQGVAVAIDRLLNGQW